MGKKIGCEALQGNAWHSLGKTKDNNKESQSE
jgi:hypothetical protein